MTILVTGATGFLGGALCAALKAGGADVIGLGRDQAKLAQLERAGITPLAFDLADRANPLPPLPALSAMVHCAGLSSPWGRYRDHHIANVTGTANALALAAAGGAKRFVHISTPSVYFRFADQWNVAEDTRLPRPVNAYARSKRAAEALVLAHQGLDPIVLRPRGIYGAGDTSLVPRLVRAARRGPLPLLRGGKAVTDLTHVDDVVAAITATLSAPAGLNRRVFNVSGGEALLVTAVAEAAGQAAGVPVRWRALPTGPALLAVRALALGHRLMPTNPEPIVTPYSLGLFAFSQTLNIARARIVLGYTPHVSFADGLQRTFGKDRP